MDKKYSYFAPTNKVYMIIIAVLICTILGYKHFIIGLIATAFYIFLIIYNVNLVKVKKYEWKKFIEEFSLNLDTATKNTLINSPFPLLLIDNDGNITWYNKYMVFLSQNEDIFGKNINDYVKEINLRNIFEGKKKKFKDININNKFYDIYTSIIISSDKKKENESLVLLYFYDVTELHEIKINMEEKKESILLLEIDNMDEALKTIEDDKRPLLIAEVERTINNFSQSIEGMVKKYSSNKYIMIAQDKYIHMEMDKKFSVLDDIRELNFGNKFAVTLSIGIGRGGETPLENYNFAMTAKDLALGRGGDQAVVKNNSSLSFYGGKTKEVEKRSKVRARVISHALVSLINESSNIIIMGHVNPDLDCIGASIGLYSIVKTMNKKCYILLDSIPNSIKAIMNKFEQEGDHTEVFQRAEVCKASIDDNTLLILADVNSQSYVYDKDLLKLIKRVITIDHHRKSTDSIDYGLLTYIEPYASSASEMVTELIQYISDKHKIKQLEAEALLAGICVDTKNFSFKTGVRTFEAASFLRSLGADTIEIKKMFSNDLETYIGKSKIISSSIVKNGIAVAVCPPEIEDNVLAAKAADELLNITGIQACFVIVKIDNEVSISGRSLGEINVQLILESLGGGGHLTMAGARIENTTIVETAEKLKNAIDKYLREGEIK